MIVIGTKLSKVSREAHRYVQGIPEIAARIGYRRKYLCKRKKGTEGTGGSSQ